MRIKQYNTFAVVESENCKTKVFFDVCRGGSKLVILGPAEVEYRHPQLLAKFELDRGTYEWYLLEFFCKKHYPIPIILLRRVIGGDKGFLIVHDFITAYPIPLKAEDSFHLFSMDEGMFFIEELIRKAVYKPTPAKDMSPYSDDPFPIDPEVRILFLNECFAKIYEEEYKIAKRKA